MFERKGIFKLKDSNVDLLGYHTEFRNAVSKAVFNVVNSGLWFSFCSRISEKQYDVMKLKSAKGDTIGHLTAQLYSESNYKIAIYKYMVLDYLCYIETPMVKRNTGNNNGYSNTYDKFLATSNPYVVAEWMGISYDDVLYKYGSNIPTSIVNNESDLIPYLKLWVDKDGTHKITKPRKTLDLGKMGTRVIPVFALKTGVDTLYHLAQENYIEVLFQKDSGQERKIAITFNVPKIRDIYGDTDFLRKGIEDMYDGDFMANSNMSRGYIRVFEIGGSIYDSPTRSINYARIIGIKKVPKEELDLAYINVDLDSVTTVFSTGLNNNYKHVKAIISAMKDSEISGISAVSPYSTVLDLENWVSGQVTLLSTTFLRELALFMLGHNTWFNGYTGEPVGVSSSVVPNEDIDFGLDLDFNI